MTNEHEPQCKVCGISAFFIGLCLAHYRQWRAEKRGGT